MVSLCDDDNEAVDFKMQISWLPKQFSTAQEDSVLHRNFPVIVQDSLVLIGKLLKKCTCIDKSL
jgi:hypothetical protein